MQSQDTSIGRMRLYVGRFYIGMTGLALIGSAIAKLAHVPKVVNELGAMGFDGNRLLFIGLLEIVCAILFLYPATRSLGLVMVSAYMGGAIATHMQHGQSILQPSIVLFLMWLGAFLRHPETMWSLSHRTGATITKQNSTYQKGVAQGI